MHLSPGPRNFVDSSYKNSCAASLEAQWVLSGIQHREG